MVLVVLILLLVLPVVGVGDVDDVNDGDGIRSVLSLSLCPQTMERLRQAALDDMDDITAHVDGCRIALVRSGACTADEVTGIVEARVATARQDRCDRVRCRHYVGRLSVGASVVCIVPRVWFLSNVTCRCLCG